MRVLLVEDDPAIREVVAEILSSRGHEVSACETAESAWVRCQADFFSLCITDWMLPGMDGLELTRLLRQQLGGQRTTILVMTGRQQPGDLDAVLDAGADDYLAKPFDLELIETRLTIAERRAYETEARHEAEAAVIASHRRYRALIEHSSDGIVLIDAHGINVYASPSIERILGYPVVERVGTDVFTWIHPEEVTAARDFFEQVLAHPGSSFEDGFRLFHRDGSFRWIEGTVTNLLDDPSVQAVVANFHDSTERKRLEQQLLRAQRLDAAGRLAGQVAHDFNNLLAPLAGYPELIKGSVPDTHVAASYCDAMLAAVKQIVQINDELIAMSHRGHTEYQPVQLDRLVTEALASLPSALDTIPLELHLANDLLPVHGSAAQIQRVLVNLLTNAGEAAGPHGQVTLTAANVYLDEPVRRYTEVAVGEYVRLDIHDDGPGIPLEIQDRIFDAFFTTKTTSRRRGSGLGLSVVQAIVEEHRGYIDLDSLPHQGTTFRVYLPISRTAPSTLTGGAPPLGTESVLVVDDDPWQRQVLAQLLADLGYTVETVSSGEAALAYLQQDSPDLLILDMIMPPGLDGTETFRQARAHRPDQRALLVSGYAEVERVQEARTLGISGFLHKPVTRPGLARAVREALDRAPSLT